MVLTSRERVQYVVNIISQSIKSNLYRAICRWAIPDFGFRLRQIQNPAIFRKSGHGSAPTKQISSWIWQMPMQMQYVQSVTDKTNAADMSDSLFAILISVARVKKKYKFHCRSTNFVKNWQTAM